VASGNGRDLKMVSAKKQAADQAVKQVKQYETCLMNNSDAITAALDINDYAAIKVILDNCGVPKGKQNNLLEFAIQCYEQRFHQW